MNRRIFIFMALISLLLNGWLKLLASTGTFVTEGKLGYKLKANKGRHCLQCKYYIGNKNQGECKLMAMRNAMKSKVVYVKATATCFMWTKLFSS